MKKFKKFYQEYIKESIFVPLTAKEVIERKAATPGYKNTEGQSTSITFADLKASVKPWKLFDMTDIDPTIDGVKEYLLTVNLNDSLYEKMDDVASNMAMECFNKYDIPIYPDNEEDYYELEKYITNQCDISPIGHVYDDYLFITEQPMSVRKDNMEEDIDRIYSYTVSSGISKYDIRKVLNDSTYGGKVTIGLVGSVNTADKGYVEGNPMIAIGDAYMIGNRIEKLAGTSEEIGNMIDIELGNELNTDEWACE